MIWERLTCLAGSGTLCEAAQTRLNALSSSYPDWQLDPDPHSEASPPGMGCGHEEFARLLRIKHAPRTRRELVAWLKRDEPKGFFDTDDWQDICGSRMLVAAAALCDLAREDEWPLVRWQTALSTWRDEKRVSRSWRLIARLVENIPAKEFAELTPELSLWLRSAASVLDRHEPVFIDLCRRILEQPSPAIDNTDDSSNIDHPISRITQALLNLCFRRGAVPSQRRPRIESPGFARPNSAPARRIQQ